jgi:hypothetical protein
MRKIILIIGMVFLINLVSAIWVDDPLDCPVEYNFVSCTGGELQCGIEGGSAPYCYDMTLLDPPSTNEVSNAGDTYQSGLGGGFILDCEDTDSGEPYCDNDEELWCNRDNVCYSTRKRKTNCVADAWVSSTCDTCRTGYLNCTGDIEEQTDSCEVQVGVSPCGDGANNNIDSNCDCVCDANYYDCDSSGAGAGTGCDTRHGGDCSAGDLDGTYSCSVGAGGCYRGGTQYICNCVVTKSNFETGTETPYSTSDALLWGSQYGSGYLINMTNGSEMMFGVNNSGCVVFPDGTVQCSGASDTNVSGLVPYSGATGNVDLGEKNVTTTGSGFFGWLGSLGNFITGLFVVDINASGNVDVGGNLSVGGNVGIGTTSPEEKLHIKDGNIALEQDDGLRNYYGFFYNQHVSGTYYQKLGTVYYNNGGLRLSGVLSGHEPGQGKANVDIFISNRDEFLVNGHIDGLLNSASKADIVLYQDESDNIDVYLKTFQYAQVNLDLSVAGDTVNGTINVTSETTDVPTGTLIYTLSENFTNFVMDNDGNVGIGTNSPSTKLEVAGSVNVSGVYYGNGSGLTDINASWWAGLTGWVGGWFDESGDELVFNETKLNETIASEGVALGFNSTYNATYDAKNSSRWDSDGENISYSDGNVEILNELIVGEYATTAGRITILDNGSKTEPPTIFSNDDGDLVFEAHANTGDIELSIDGFSGYFIIKDQTDTSLMSVRHTNGDTWIKGATTVDGLLTSTGGQSLTGGTAITGLNIFNSTAFRNHHPIINDGYGIQWGDGSVRIVGSSTTNDDYLKFKTASTDSLTIDKAGNVGIGTIEPKANLHVLTQGTTSGLAGAPAGRGMVITGTDGYNRLYFESTDATSNNRVFAIDNTDGLLAFKSLNNDASSWKNQVLLVMNSVDANVGIGLNDSLSKLHIVARDGFGLTEALRLENRYSTAGSATGIMFSTSPAGYAKTGIFFENDGVGNARGDLHFAVDGAANTEDVSLDDIVMTLKRGGDVGIGTDSPSEKLEVNGSILANGNILAVGPAGDVNSFIAGKGAGQYLTTGSENVMIGASAGNSTALTTGSYNTFIGYQAGRYVTGNLADSILIGRDAGLGSGSAASVVAIGYAAGSYGVMSDSVVIGPQAGQEAIGNKGVAIGHDAGREASIEGSVFLGSYAGYGEWVDNKLHIGNTYGSSLIEGDFANDWVKIYGNLEVTENISADYFVGDGSRLTGVSDVWSVSGSNISYSDGSVGIGTTSPDAQLSLGGAAGTSGTAGGSQLALGGANNAGTNANGYKLYISNYDNDDASYTYPIYVIDEDDNVDFWLRSASSGAAKPTMYFRGDVGIGTSSPTAELDVDGSATDGKSLQLRSGDLGTGTDSSQIIFSFDGQPYNNYGYAHSIRTRHNDTEDADNAIDFWIWNTGAGNPSVLGNERVMTIEGTGRVGIGTSEPTQRLDVDGNVNVSGTLYANNVSSNSPLRLQTGGVTRIFVNDSTGNVGIGTDEPLANLHIATLGSTSALGTIPVNRGMILTGHESGSNRLYFENLASDSGERVFVLGNVAGIMKFSSMNNDATGGGTGNILVMEHTGNVGIGTDDPGELLEIEGASTTLLVDGRDTAVSGETGKVRIGGARNAGNNHFASLFFQNYDNYGTDVDFDGAEIAGIHNGSDNAGLQFRVATNKTLADAMTILSGGNVGIGTTSPDVDLTIGDSTTTGGKSIHIEDQDDAFIFLEADEDNTGGEDGNPYIKFSQDGALVRTIIGSVDTGKDPENNDYTGALGNAFLIGGLDAYDMQLGTNSNVRMTIDKDGMVGIGTDDPSTKLEVVGTINATDVCLNDGTCLGDATVWSVNGDDIYYVDGDVGIGTTGPAVNLDVGGTSASGKSLQLRSGDATGQADSSQIILSYNGYSYDSLGYAHSIRTRHDGTADGSNAIDFWIWNTDTTNPSTLGDERVLTITGEGFVGIGDSTPTQSLEVKGRIKSQYWVGDGDTAIYKNSGGVIGITASDSRMKKNIKQIKKSLDIVDKIKTYEYNSIDENNSDKKRLGLLGDELVKIMPELTFTFSNGDSNETYYGVHYDKLPVLNIKAIQELKEMFDALVGGNYSVDVKPVFDKDMVGTATVLVNSTFIEVEFVEEYGVVPVVTLTPVGLPVMFYLDDVTNKSFKIFISEVQEEEVKFNWHAFAVVGVSEGVEVSLNESVDEVVEEINEGVEVSLNESVVVNETINETNETEMNVSINESVIVNETIVEEVLDGHDSGEPNETIEANITVPMNETVVENETEVIEEVNDSEDINKSVEGEGEIGTDDTDEHGSENESVVVEVEEEEVVENVSGSGSLITGGVIGVGNEENIFARFIKLIGELF